MPPPTFGTPGVYVQEVPSGVHRIAGVPTSVALFIGWAPRGPIGRAVAVHGMAEYSATYGGADTGGLDHRSLLGYAVRHFFDNGGRDALIVRLAAADARPALVELDGWRFEATSPGSWGNDCQVHMVADAADATRFSLQVSLAATGRVLESFSGLSLQPDHPRFVSTAVNATSALVRVAAVGAAIPSAAFGLGGTSAGADGTVIGPGDAAFHQAVRGCFEPAAAVDGIAFNLLSVPGLADPPTLHALQAQCLARRAFLLVDAPAEARADTVASTLGHMNLKGDGAENSAIFFPWVLAADPLQGGAVRPFPPAGFIAGLAARTDADRGVWKAPAGNNLAGATGFSVELTDEQNGVLNPLAINCLRSFPGRGHVLWGARTLAGDDSAASQWKYIPVRRLALFIEQSLDDGLRWVVFEPNGEATWQAMRASVGMFMQDLWRQGAFQGSTPREAYYVNCGRDTCTDEDVRRGVVVVKVGFAPVKPAEFVVLRLQLQSAA